MKFRSGFIVTIGSFDGVHLGHQALLDRTIAEAQKRHVRSLALTFEIPPKMVLQPRAISSVLTTPQEKEHLLKIQGIDQVSFLNFNGDLSKVNGFYFFKYLLLQKFCARGIVVGLDFRFGVNRSAGALELVRWGQDYDIPVWVIPPVRHKREIISSSQIRTLIQNNNFPKALSLLGHPYPIFGEIVHGRGYGRKLGFPTANLKVPKIKLLPRGVFVLSGEALDSRGRRLIINGRPHFNAVGNIGVRPTMLKRSQVTVEAHNLGGPFSSKTVALRLQLLKRLRAEKRFPSIKSLKRAIKQDVLSASSFFTQKRPFDYNGAT